MSLRRSTLKLSDMTQTNGWPVAAQTIASPMPVLPLDASTTVCADDNARLAFYAGDDRPEPQA